MAINSRSYKWLCSLYRGVLSRGRVANARARSRLKQSDATGGLEQLEPRIMLAADLSLLGAGMLDFLPELEAQIISGVFATPVPGIGNDLSNNDPNAGDDPGEIFNKLEAALADFDAGTNPDIDAILAELAQELGDLLVDGITGIDVLGTDASSEIKFELTLSDETTYADALKFDFALGSTGVLQSFFGPDTVGLGDKQVDVTVGYTWKLKFGVSETDGFFIETGLDEELVVDVEARIDSSFEMFGKMGVMPSTFTEFVPTATIPAPTDRLKIFEGTYDIDVTSTRDDQRLVSTDTFAGVGTDAVLTGGTDMLLHTAGGVLPAFLDLAGIGLPIDDLFDMRFDADLQVKKTFVRDDVSADTFGQEATVEFLDVMFDVDSFIESFLEPIILDLQSLFIPLGPLFDFLTFEIPVLGDIIDAFDIDLGLDFGGDSVFEEQPTQSGQKLKPTMLDLILALAKKDKTKKNASDKVKRAVQVLDAIRTYASRPKTTGAKQMEPVGSFMTNGEGGVKMKSPRSELNSEVKKKFVAGGALGNKVKSINNDFAFPFLESPEQIFNVMLGNNGIDIFTFNTAVAFDAIWTGFVPLYLVLGMTLRGGVGFDIDFGAGFQSDGLNRFLNLLDYSSKATLEQSALEHFDELDAGLFFDDHNSDLAAGDRSDGDGNIQNPKDKPEFKVGVELAPGLALGLDIGVARAFGGVGGGVEVNFEFDLNDLPDTETFFDTGEQVYDGRVDLAEIDRITPSGFDNLFNIAFTGQAFIELFLTVEAGVSPFSFRLLDLRKKWTTPPIFSLPINTPSDADLLNGDFVNPTVLGEVDPDDGTLTLFAGDLAGFRSSNADPTEINEEFKIQQQAFDTDEGTATILITAFNRVQVLSGVKRVQGDFGDGDDVFRIVGNTDVPVNINGGDGNDELSQTRFGLNTVFNGGDGDDILLGGQGDDELIGGNGNDVLSGSDGDDTLNGGAGDDELIGGVGKDELRGGTGNDILRGGRDDDLLFGSDGNDQLYGGFGNDLLMGEDGDDYLEGNFGKNTLNGGNDDDTFLVVLDDSFRNPLDDGVDTIIGGGQRAGTRGDRLTIQGEVEMQRIEVEDDLPRTARVELGDTVDLSEDNGGLLITTQADNLQISGVEALTLALGGGADTVTMNDLSGTGLNRTDLVFFEDGSIDEVDTLIVNGTESADQIVATRGNVDLFDENGDPIDIPGSRPSIEIDFFNTDAIVSETLPLPVINGVPPTNGVFLDPSVGTVSGPHATILGASSNDKLIINGNGGNDVIQRGTKNPTPVNLDDDAGTSITLEINGGTGNDTIRAVNFNSAGAALVHGGDGNDTIFGGRASETLHGDAGNDTIFGGPDDVFNNLSDTIFGGTGDDTIYGTNSADELHGDAGNDTIFGLEGADTIFGGDDDDDIDAGFGDDDVFGEDGNDTLFGGEDGPGGVNGFDSLFGGDGNDTLNGRIADRLLDGGTGTNTMTFDTAAAAAGAFAPNIFIADDGITVDFNGFRDTTNFANTSPDTTFTVTLGDDPGFSADNKVFIDGSLPVGKTVINGTGDSTDIFVINNTSGELEINSGDGADSFLINGLSHETTINAGAGGDKISFIPTEDSRVHSNVSADLTFNAGAGNDSLLFRDTGTSIFDINLSTISDTSFSGFSLPTGVVITHSGLTQLDFELGRATDLLTIESTPANSVTNVSTGGNKDSVDVQTFTNELNLDGGIGPDIFGEESDQLGLSNAAIAASQSGDTLTATNFEAIRLDDSAETGNTDWVFDGNTLTKNAAAVLSYGPGGGFPGISFGTVEGVALLSGSGNDTITVLNNTIPIDINAGPGTDTITIGDATSVDTLANHSAAITVNGGNDTADDTFIVDFSGNDGNSNIWDWALDELTISTGPGVVPPASLRVGLDGTFEDVQLDIGRLGSTLSIRDTFPGTALDHATMTVTGSDDAEFIFIDGVNEFTDLTLDLGDGNNELNIGGTYRDPVARSGEPIAGPITITGDGRLETTLDRSFDRLGRAGTIGTEGITGLGMGGIDTTGIQVQSIDAILGTGADTVVITDTKTLNNFTARITIDGNFGNDTLTAVAAGFKAINQERLKLIGGPGRDTTIIEFDDVAAEAPNLGTPGNPELIFDSESLIVDNATGTANVAWTLTDGVLEADGNFIADTGGIDAFELKAGTGGADTFTVEQTGNASLDLLVDSESVTFIRDPSVILSVGETIGIPGADTTPVNADPDSPSLLVSPDGAFVYTISRDRDSIVIYPRDPNFGNLGFPLETGQGTFPLDPFNSGSAVVVSPDGNDVYFASRGGLFQLDRDTDTGLVDIKLGLTASTRPVKDFAISQDGLFAFASVNRVLAEGFVEELIVYSRSQTTGRLTQIQALPVAGNILDDITLAVSPDGNSVYVTTDFFNPAGGDRITVFSRPDANSEFANLQTLNSTPPTAGALEDGLNGIHGVAVSPDGEFVYTAGRRAVAVFARADDGTLTPSTVFDSTTNPDLDASMTGVAVSPDNQSIYVTSSSSTNSILRFARDTSTDAHTFEQGVNPTDLTAVSGITVSDDGTRVYAFQSNSGTVAVFARAASGALTRLDSVDNADPGVRGLDGVGAVAVSPDGEHVYTVGFNALAVLGPDGADDLRYLDALVQGDARNRGLVDPLVATMSHDGNHIYVASLGERNGSIAVYDISSSSGTPTFEQVIFDDLPGFDRLSAITDITVSPDDRFVYVASEFESEFTTFSRDADTGELTFVASNALIADTVIVSPDGTTFHISFPLGNVLNSVNRNTTTGALSGAAFDSEAGVGNVVSMAITPDGNTVFAASEDLNTVFVFDRDVAGNLTLRHTFEDGAGGVDGLAGADNVVVSPDGKRAYASGRGGDESIAVFDRDPDTGDWSFIGAIALPESPLAGPGDPPQLPTAIAVSPDGLNVYVARGDEGAGGITLLSPPQFNVNFSQVNDLTVKTGAGNDVLALVNPPAGVTMTLNAGNGNNTVAINDTAATTTVTTGTGQDTVEVLGTGNARATNISTGSGEDTVNLWGVGTGSTMVIDLGNNADVFSYSLDALAGAGNMITLNGGSPSAPPGDVLIGESTAFFANPALPIGLFPNFGILIAGSTQIQYFSFEFPMTGAGVARPTADAADRAISEGNPVTLDATGSTIGVAPLVSFEWDLNSDGIFGDVTGSTPTLTWEALSGFGIDDDGVYPISLRVTDDDGLVDVDTATITVNNTAPVATLSGDASVGEGSLYTLELSINDPGDDTVSQVEINWGDGITETLDVGVPFTHIYADGPAQHTIQANVIDEDGTHAAANTLDVQVTDVAPQLSIASDSNAIEGDPYLLFLTVDSNPGQDTITQWTINWGDGSDPETIPVADINPGGFVSHVFGATPPSSVFEISALATDEDGTHNAGNTVTVTVTDVADKPLLVTIEGDDSVDEDTQYTLNLISDAPAGDPILSWTIDWGDGTTPEIIQGSPESATHVYDTPGVYEITASATDSDGLHPVDADNPFTPQVETDPFLVTVLDVAPIATISGPAQTNEGDQYTLTLATANPGMDAVIGWTIDWGDGTVDTIAGDPASATHVYPDGPQAFEINASVTYEKVIDDGPSGDGIVETTVTAQNTVSVTVNNVAPTLRLVGDPSIDEGGVYQLFLAPSDPGTDIISNWIIDWGDGTTQHVAGNPNSVGHEYTDGTLTATITATAFDEDSPLGVATADLALNWDAADPGSNPGSQWQPNSNNGVPPINWQFTAATPINNATTTSSDIDAAFVFDGNNPVVTQQPFGTLPGLVTQDASFELWVKPDDLLGQEIILESGGVNAGMSLRLDGDGDGENPDRLVFRVKDGTTVLEAETTLTADEISDFVHVVVTIETGVGADAVIGLYVNGEQRGTAQATGGQSLQSWALEPGDALGGRTAVVGGDNAGDLNAFGGFVGEIAQVRLYAEALSPSQVLGNFVAVATGNGAGSAIAGAPNTGYTTSGVSQFTLPISVHGDGALGNLRFYLPTPAAGDWQSAQDEAVTLGGHLLWINNQGEQDFIDETFLGGGTTEYWIGLANVADPADPADFQWTRGALFAFTNFAPGEPNGSGDFVFLQDQGDGTSQWLDDSDAANRLGIIKLATLSGLPDSAFTASTTDVTVNNVDPVLTISGNSSVEEGAQYALSLDLVEDPGDDTPSQFVVDWGDGNTETFEFDPDSTADGVLTSLPAALLHTYADGFATHTITVDMIDDDGTYIALASTTVDVTDAAPTIALPGAVAVDEGLLYTLTLGPVTDPGDDTVTQYIINWGDGTPTEMFASAGDVTHIYAGGDVQRTITVDLVNEDGTFIDAGQKTIFINDVTLVIELTGAASVDEGNSYTLNFGPVTDPSDPEPSALPEITQYIVRWGDGTVEPLPSTATSASHTYTDGDFTHAVTVDLVTAAVGTFPHAGLLETAVNNVAPVIAPIADANLLPGQTLTAVGSFTDPGMDTFTATVDYGQGDGPTTLPLNSDGTFSLSNRYEAAGGFTVTVAVTDDDGDTTTETFLVSVADELTVFIDDVTVSEDDTTATFTVSLSKPALQDVTVSFTTADGTATSDGDPSLGEDDYAPLAGSVMITAGQTSAPINVTINDDTLFEDDETFTVSLTAVTQGNATISDSEGTGTIVNDDGPSVTEVLVSGTSWSAAALEAVDPGRGLGHSIPNGSPDQTQTLQWVNVNQVHLVFEGDVQVSQNDLNLYGLNVPSYAFLADDPTDTLPADQDGFRYDPSTFTATWTLNTTIDTDKLLLVLADTVNANGVALDGETTDPLNASLPSGDGTPGGTFAFGFNVLPGDATHDGTVNGQDLLSWQSDLFNTGFVLPPDFNLDGTVNGQDLLIWQSHLFNALPTGSHGPAVAEVLVSGTAWSAAALEAVDPGRGVGHAIPNGSPDQTQTLQWVNINQVHLVFTRDVQVSQDDLSLHGVNVSEYTFLADDPTNTLPTEQDGFRYDPVTFTATWTLNTTINTDKLLLVLADTVNNSGAPLDGETVDPLNATLPSGDGIPGGDFAFGFNVLPGDATHDGVVNGQDLLSWQSDLFNTGFVLPPDFNLDGTVNGQDLLAWQSHLFNAIPTGSPTPSPAAIPEAEHTTTGQLPYNAVASEETKQIPAAPFTPNLRDRTSSPEKPRDTQPPQTIQRSQKIDTQEQSTTGQDRRTTPSRRIRENHIRSLELTQWVDRPSGEQSRGQHEATNAFSTFKSRHRTNEETLTRHRLAQLTLVSLLPDLDP